MSTTPLRGTAARRARPRSPRPANRRALAVALQYTLLVRLGLVGVTLMTVVIPNQTGHAAPSLAAVWQRWAEWDGVWFEHIAQGGYTDPRAFAFFPLYPLLVRAVLPLTGHSVPLAAVLVSAAASAAGFTLLFRLVEAELDADAAERAVRYLALFPTGFFLAVAYSEPLFLTCALLFVTALRQERWGLAAAGGCAAALTRVVGVALALPAAWVWMVRRRSAGGGPPSRAGGAGRSWLAVAAAPAGLGLYVLYCLHATGDPLAFVHAEGAWWRALTWPWTTAAEAVHAAVFGPDLPGNLLDLAAVVGTAAALASGARWLNPVDQIVGWSLLAMAVAAPVQPGHGDVLLSATRLVLVVYPTFIVLARWGSRPWLDRTLTTLLPLLQAGAFVLFTHGYFVA